MYVFEKTVSGWIHRVSFYDFCCVHELITQIMILHNMSMCLLLFEVVKYILDKFEMYTNMDLISSTDHRDWWCSKGCFNDGQWCYTHRHCQHGREWASADILPRLSPQQWWFSHCGKKALLANRCRCRRSTTQGGIATLVIRELKQ